MAAQEQDDWPDHALRQSVKRVLSRYQVFEER